MTILPTVPQPRQGSAARDEGSGGLKTAWKEYEMQERLQAWRMPLPHKDRGDVRDSF